MITKPNMNKGLGGPSYEKTGYYTFVIIEGLMQKLLPLAKQKCSNNSFAQSPRIIQFIACFMACITSTTS